MVGEAEFFVDQLHKDVLPDKVVWWIVIDSKRIDFSTATLLFQRRFWRKVFRAVQKLPPRRAPVNFDKWVDNVMQYCVVHDIADPVRKGPAIMITFCQTLPKVSCGHLLRGFNPTREILISQGVAGHGTVCNHI